MKLYFDPPGISDDTESLRSYLRQHVERLNKSLGEFSEDIEKEWAALRESEKLLTQRCASMSMELLRLKNRCAELEAEDKRLQGEINSLAARVLALEGGIVTQ